MKVLICCFTMPKYMPYLPKYLSTVIDCSWEYDILYMDRDCDEPHNFSSNEYCYEYKMPIEKKIFSKVLPYLGYRKFAKKLLYNNNYDKLIFLTTAPAVLLSRYYLNKYKGKYILDYRDYTFERIGAYQRLVKNIIDNSFATFISSNGFKKFIGNSNKIHLTHNISNVDEIDHHHASDITKNIVIGFVGCVRYFDINSKLINDCQGSDVSLIYVGPQYNDCDLKAFCKDNNVSNVKFIDSFNNSEKNKIYSEITFVNAIYSLKSPEVSEAIPNRLYDAAIYKKPIIVSKGTYLEKIVNKYKLGIAVDMQKDNILEMINEFLSEYHPDIFEANCKRFLEKVMKDEKAWKTTLMSFLLNKETYGENTQR